MRYEKNYIIGLPVSNFFLYISRGNLLYKTKDTLVSMVRKEIQVFFMSFNLISRSKGVF